MRYEQIKELLLNHFKKDNTPSSYTELVSKLRITRKDKGFLKRALEELHRNGELISRKRRYSPPPRAKRQIKAENAKEQLPSSLLSGIFDATPLSRDRSFAFVRTAEGDFYIDAENTFNAFHNDKVAIQIIRRNPKDLQARVTRILKRANQTMAGDIHFNRGKAVFVCSNPKIHKWFNVSDTGKAKEGDKVVLKVTNWGSPSLGKLPTGKVSEILGPSGDPQVELIAVIKQFDLPLEFDPTILAETDKLTETISDAEIAKREDLRDLLTFTIDPASAKDFDDAISIKKDKNGFTLWVHIADVSHYVTPKTETFIEATKRGNSFYFPKKVIPMLPERISNSICSLRPNEDKLCLSLMTMFDPKGRIKQQRLVESVIRSDARLSYEDVDVLYNKEPSKIPPNIQKALWWGLELSGYLSKKRLSEGYIFFDLPELEYEYDDNGFIKRLSLSAETPSHKLIENFMLVANEYVATRLGIHSPTSLYRIHEEPDSYKLQRLDTLLSHYGLELNLSQNLNLSLQYLLNSMPNEDYHKVFDRMVLRSLKKAKYTVEHKGHFGLGLKNYTHFTSPIRRLCDLVIHILCKDHLLKSTKHSLNKKQLTLYAETASNQELLADEAEREIERIYSLAFIKKHIGDHFNATVISTNSQSLIVRLEEIPISAVLNIAILPGGPWIYQQESMRFINRNTSVYYQLMDKLKVQVIEVTDDIYVGLAKSKKAHIHPPLLPPINRIDAKAPSSKMARRKIKNKRTSR